MRVILLYALLVTFFFLLPESSGPGRNMRSSPDRRLSRRKDDLVVVDGFAALGLEQAAAVAHRGAGGESSGGVLEEGVVEGHALGEARAAELPLRLQVCGPFADVLPGVLQEGLLVSLGHQQRRQVAHAHAEALHQLLRVQLHLVQRAVDPCVPAGALAHVGLHAGAVHAPQQRALGLPAHVAAPALLALAHLLPEGEDAVLAALVTLHPVPAVRAGAELRLRAHPVQAGLAAHRLLAAASLVAVLARAVGRPQTLAVQAALVAYGLLAKLPRVALVADAGHLLGLPRR
eukprot:scaffold2989_cov387-Prasinococcus_capsulatus_cf.AAC.5